MIIENVWPYNYDCGKTTTTKNLFLSCKQKEKYGKQLVVNEIENYKKEDTD